MSRADAELRKRNLRTLGALAALFFLPLAVAFLLYYGTDWRPLARVNHGMLIIPARPLPAVVLPLLPLAGGAGPAGGATPQGSGAPARASFRFGGKWTLVYVGSGACTAACRESLYVMRQTRLALNADMTRVERVFLVTGECCARDFLAREHPGLLVADAAGQPGARLLSAFPADGRAHTLYIIDPLGNLMMSYDARIDPRGLLIDLQKLLKLSHIG